MRRHLRLYTTWKVTGPFTCLSDHIHMLAAPLQGKLCGCLLSASPRHPNELFGDGSDLGMGQCLQKARTRSSDHHPHCLLRPGARYGGVPGGPAWILLFSVEEPCHQQPQCQQFLAHPSHKKGERPWPGDLYCRSVTEQTLLFRDVCKTW